MNLSSVSTVIRACRYRSLEELKLLFEKYCVNCQDHYGNTPLHEAAMWGREDLVVYLLKKGANPKAKDKFDLTPFDRAKRRGHNKIMMMLNYYCLS